MALAVVGLIKLLTRCILFASIEILLVLLLLLLLILLFVLFLRIFVCEAGIVFERRAVTFAAIELILFAGAPVVSRLCTDDIRDGGRYEAVIPFEFDVPKLKEFRGSGLRTLGPMLDPLELLRLAGVRVVDLDGIIDVDVADGFAPNGLRL